QNNFTFDYRRAITIDNTQNSSNLYDYQVGPITVDYVDGKMNTDFSDLRFTDDSTNWNDHDWDTSYSYWIENPQSCSQVLARNPSATSGIYTISPNGSDSFDVYCDMETDGGGWTLIMNLDSNDGTNHHYDDTTFWTGDNTVGSVSSALTNDFKSKSFALNNSSEIMVWVHNEGSQTGYATYNTLASYQDKSFYWLLNNLSATTITSTRVNNTGTTGAQYNPDRVQTEYGDIFLDHSEALVINRQSAWASDTYNKNRITTTLTNNDYS
ncbi:unnamed protein product, partial [marine sediment metagenome]